MRYHVINMLELGLVQHPHQLRSSGEHAFFYIPSSCSDSKCMTIATMKPVQGSSEPINPDTGSKATAKDRATPGYLKGSGRQKQKAPPSQSSESKIVRLKFTKPRPPKPKPQEVDWDEDLRPTPNEIAENKGTHGGTSVAYTDPKRPKTVGRNTGSKRAMESKPQTTSAKRRKSNRKSTTTKEGSNGGPQLPLITLTASALPPAAPLGNNGLSDMGPLDGQSKDYATKLDGHVPEALNQPSLPTDGHNKHGNNSERGVIVGIRSCTSVTTESSSDFEDHGKGPSRTSKVSILEHRAQSNRQTDKGKSVYVMPEVSSSSDIDLKGPSRITPSKVTILESRALPKERSSQAKTVHDKSHPKNGGRAQSVGNKLMLALHGAEPSHYEPVNDRNAPLIISSDSVQPQESPRKQQSDQMPIETVLESSDIRRVLDKAIPVEIPPNQTEPETVNPALITKTLPPKEEKIEQLDDASFWKLLGDDRMSTPASSSEFEAGRGLMGNSPSILDYHMEMEHIPGFATLQPMRSAPTTPSHATNIYESQADSSGISEVGKLNDLIAGIEGREGSHTPESQKPLLTNESLMEPNYASPHPPKSVMRTSIVDGNGSPRLMPQSAKSMVSPQFDLDGESGHEETIIVTHTSPSQYDRSSCSISTESKYEGLMWTKFQRDIFLEYGIQTEKLAKSHPWPPPKKHRPSFSQEDTADGAHSEKASTTGPSSSQRTIDERALGSAPKNHEYLDQSSRTDISGSTQSADKSNQSSARGDHDDMEWISTLQVAQKDAHHLLQQTNLVSRYCLCEWDRANWRLEFVHSAGGRKGHYQSSPGDLPRGM